MISDDEICITCGWNKFLYSEMIPGGWFCEECGTPSAKTQETARPGRTRQLVMTNLSPDAQKVLDASMVHSGPAFETIVRRMLADALRTVADQVVPTNALYARQLL
jgi:hypothetical protein